MTFVVSDDDVVVSMLEILARDDVSVSLDRDSDYTVRNPSESARTNSFSLSFSFLLFPSPSPLSLSLSLFLSLSLSFSLARRLTGSANAFPDGMRLVCAPRGLPSRDPSIFISRSLHAGA